jgi:CheY-like chemotaxis protein
MDSDRAGRILVVDDVPENVRLLEAVLVPHGYEVLTATSGEEALDLVASAEPDLILLESSCQEWTATPFVGHCAATRRQRCSR